MSPQLYADAKTKQGHEKVWPLLLNPTRCATAFTSTSLHLAPLLVVNMFNADDRVAKDFGERVLWDVRDFCSKLPFKRHPHQLFHIPMHLAHGFTEASEHAAIIQRPAGKYFATT